MTSLTPCSWWQELAEPTIRCLTKRFALYYGHKPLLKLVIGPFVQELLQTLRSVTTGAVSIVGLRRPASPWNVFYMAGDKSSC